MLVLVNTHNGVVHFSCLLLLSGMKGVRRGLCIWGKKEDFYVNTCKDVRCLKRALAFPLGSSGRSEPFEWEA